MICESIFVAICTLADVRFFFFFCQCAFIKRCISYSDNLYNTNSDFDWGGFRQLKEEMTLSWTPPSFFSLVFSQPGVYVFKLSSNKHKHMVTQLRIISAHQS